MCLCITSQAQAKFQAGTYISQAEGRNGPVKVMVTVSEDEITGVEVVEHIESRVISAPAITNIPEDIVKYQSLGVDSVSGATLTSRAILEAAYISLESAGGNMLRLSQAVQKKSTATYETINVDVAILGSGGAGLSAAVAAADNKASVVLFEKLPMYGGSTLRSSGVILYASSESNLCNKKELSAFITERSENHANADLVEKIVNISPDIFKWISGFGVKFTKFEANYPGYKPLRIANPDPSGALNYTAGADIINVLYKEALERDVDIRMNTAGEKLIVKNGAVVGVTARTSGGGTVTCNAKAVIIATGGYINNPEMQRKYATLTVGTPSLSSTGNTGDGIYMAQDVGAATVFGGNKGAIVNVRLDAFKNMSKSFLYIDTNGNRFVNEEAFYDNVAKAMLINKGKRFFRIYDSSSLTTGLEQAAGEGKAVKADSIEELAKAIDVNGTLLTKTVNRYNSLKGKTDADFGKRTSLMNGISKAPYYAVKAEPEIIGSLGGIKINTNAEVVAINGGVIPGLYAAGETANGEIFYRDYAYTGAATLYSLATGRIAGENAAKYSKK